MTSTNRAEMQGKALDRARNGDPNANYLLIYAEFQARGIPAEEIKPRINVFTYNAWKALGRQVKRGEHGVHIMTVIEDVDKDTGEVVKKRIGGATVFHVSQTKEVG